MHMNKTKSERNGSLEYYHVTCVGKQNIQANIKRPNGLQSAQVSPIYQQTAVKPETGVKESA